MCGGSTMKRIVAFALAASCCSLFLGCSESATETTVGQVAAPRVSAAKIARGATTAQAHEVHKEVAEDSPVDEAPSIPKVLLTSEHSAMCRVRTGDQLPSITLPQLGGENTELAKLEGKQATVVLFWSDDPWMSETALGDLAQLDIPEGVAIVGIAVKLANNEVQAATEKAQVKFPILLDADGKGFNQVGMTKMPRIYVLNKSGEIVWFDIEYSQSTQRELKQTLEVLAAAN